jgi:hypothetical protein
MKSLLTAAVLIALLGMPAIAQPDARGGYSEASCTAAKFDNSRPTGRGACNATTPGQRWQDGYASEAGPRDNFDRDPDPAIRLQLHKERDSGFPSH